MNYSQNDQSYLHPFSDFTLSHKPPAGKTTPIQNTLVNYIPGLPLFGLKPSVLWLNQGDLYTLCIGRV